MKIDAGKCVREAQVITGISNQQMAEDHKVVKQQITRWRKQPTMHLNKAQELAEYFGMDVLDFLRLGK